jgi:hypothetical protein
MLVRNIMLKKKENPIELEMIQRRLIERERENWHKKLHRKKWK